jgi:transcriptional regulator with XRE-family HTH domain
VTTFEKLWPKFRRSKRYREAFVAQHAKQEIGFQIRELLKTSELTQAELASRAGLTQGVVSRAADPAYGNLTINTLVRIAAGFDVAFVGRFVPFSELPAWFDRLHSEPFTVPAFAEEDAAHERQSSEAAADESELLLILRK